MRSYAGIGARRTPAETLEVMRRVGAALARAGWGLRSGGARGADKAFEAGCDAAHGEKQIYVADDCTDAALNLSAQYHPAWDRCSDYAKWLHGRNAMILLGEDLLQPVERLFCWTPGGEVVGGTGQALRICARHPLLRDVPVCNLAIPAHVKALDLDVDLKNLFEGVSHAFQNSGSKDTEARAMIVQRKEAK